MAPDGSLAPKNNGGTTAKNGGGGSSRHTMKKGPWTAAEDAILMEYVKKHGEGNWNAVQRNSGLMRCGKSCRLRWANHLRPNLKKGAFSSEEENLIVQLHAKLGNKWARMASQLPGRTDNEIKNYWNTRLKRRQRAGLPIYPLDIKPQNHQLPEFPQNNPSSSSLVSLLSSSHRQKPDYSTRMSIFDMFSSSPAMPTPQNLLNSPYLSKNGLALSLSSVNSPFSPSLSASLAFNNPRLSQPLPMPSIDFDYLNFGIDSRPVSRASFEHEGSIGSVSGVVGLPSIQSLVQATTTTTSSGSDHVMATSSSDANDNDHDETMDGFQQNGCNSGLLEDLLGESQALTRATKAKEISLNEEDKSEGNFLWDYKLMEDAGVSEREESGIRFGQGNVTLEHNYGKSSPSHSSMISRAKRMAASSEESNPLDDDLLSLLDNFPLAAPMPEWYDGNGNVSNGQSSNSTGGEAGKENQPESSSYSPIATASETTDHNNWNIGASSWKNLPGIY